MSETLDKTRSSQPAPWQIAGDLPANVAYLDADQRYRFVNERYAESVGRRRHEILGKTIAEVMGAAAVSAIKPQLELALTGTHFHYHHPCASDGREPGWMSVTLLPDHDALGNTLGCYVIATHCTPGRPPSLADHLVPCQKEACVFRQELAHVCEALAHEEEERNALEDKLRYEAGLVANVSEAIISTGLDLTIVSWNRAAERMYGWTEAEVVGKASLPELLRTQHPLGSPAAMLAALRTAGRWEGEISRQRKDGVRLDVWQSISLITDGAGQRCGMVVIERDISAYKRERRRTAVLSAVTRALALGSSTEDTIPKLVQWICEGFAWDLGELWRVDAGNARLRRVGNWVTPTLDPAWFDPRRWREILGLSQGLPGRVFASGRSLWCADIVEQPQMKREIAAGLVGLHCCVAVPISAGHALNGVLVFYGQQVRPRDEPLLEMLDALGRQIGDFFEHRETERRLRDRDARMHAIVNTAVDGIVTIDRRCRIELFNPAAERMFGYQAEEVIGMNLALLMPEALKPSRKAFLAQFVTRGRAGHAGSGRQLVGRRKDGSPFPLEIAIARWGSEEVHFTGVIRDISERKQLEERVLQAQKMEALGRFSAAIAHDINNLLMGINGLAVRSLEQICPTNPARTQIELLRDTAMLGASIVGQLRDFSRKRTAETATIVLDRIIARNEPMLRRLLGNQVEFSVRLQAPEAPLESNAGQLLQLLMNLALNARDAMPEGGKLTVSTSLTAISAAEIDRYAGLAAGRYLQLRVCDTGSGMSPRVLSQVFEPFFTTKPPSQGTGLGLSTVYVIVKQHGGHIEIESELGRGTSVTILFPESPATPQEAPSEKTGARPTPDAHTGETVMVVEDERLVRETIVHYLQKAGYHVLCAPDGAEALRICEASDAPVDLLLTDISLPGMRGPQLAGAVCGMHPVCRVIYMSAHPAEMLVDGGQISVADPALQKPFSDTELLALVHAVLEHSVDDGADVARETDREKEA